MPTLELNRPSVITKEIKLQTPSSSSERWFRLSSNLLPLVGFEANSRFERRVLAPGEGFELRLLESRAGVSGTKVYTREYHHRRNNPTETVIDLKVQPFLNLAFPGTIERIHITMRPGVITARPVPERTFHIRKAIRKPSTPLEAFVALSSGIDAAHFREAGFGMQALLEYRPRERRDSTDLSETGVLTALANNAFRFVFNEDIFRVDFEQIRSTLRGQPHVGVLVLSPQCDEFSFLKSTAMKARHLDTLETTADMTYECLRLIEVTQPAVVHLENVAAFASAPIADLLTLKLRRWGYHVSSGVFDARNYGGHTSRRRFYLVASVFPGFEAPAPLPAARDSRSLWSLIADQLPECRDASESSSLREGIRTSRAMFIKPDSRFSPTITKSQNRHAKDSIYIETPDGRFLVPNEEILRRLQGIPNDFDLEIVGQETAAEIIGQSVDGPMHAAFAKAIRKHLATNRGES